MFRYFVNGFPSPCGYLQKKKLPQGSFFMVNYLEILVQHTVVSQMMGNIAGDMVELLIQ